MLRLLQKQEEAFVSFCDKDVFGTRISAYRMTYGTEYPFALFYIQEKSGDVTAALCKIDSVMTLCCDEDADFEELTEFAAAIGFDSLMCDARVCRSLRLEPDKTGHIVEFAGNQKSNINENICFSKKFELTDIYSVLERSDFDGLSGRLQWLSDVAFRVKRGTARAAAIEENDETAACAMILFETEKAALIGAVATLPAFRGKGYAGALVTLLAELVKAKNKRVELLCATGGILEFYKKIGFTENGNWALIQGR